MNTIIILTLNAAILWYSYSCILRGGEPGGRGGNRPSILQGGGAEPLHFLLSISY